MWQAHRDIHEETCTCNSAKGGSIKYWLWGDEHICTYLHFVFLISYIPTSWGSVKRIYPIIPDVPQKLWKQKAMAEREHLLIIITQVAWFSCLVKFGTKIKVLERDRLWLSLKQTLEQPINTNSYLSSGEFQLRAFPPQGRCWLFSLMDDTFTPWGWTKSK